MQDSSSSSVSSSWSEEHEYMPSYHWLAALAILGSSAAGVLLPVATSRCSWLHIPDFTYVLGKCLSIGVVLSVALVHMLQPSQASMQDEHVSATIRESTEPVPFVICAVGILLMHSIELMIQQVAAGMQLRHDARDVAAIVDAEDVSETAALLPDGHPLAPSAAPPSEPHSDHEPHRHHHHHHQDPPSHQHGHAAHRDTSFVDALLLELGVSLHSIFVGLVVSVADHDELLTLAVAVCLHQLFEGVALGSRLVDAAMRPRSEAIFTAFFALSAPCGAVIGIIGMSNAHMNTESQGYLLAQSVLDALCAGILLYLGFGMLFSDFPRDMATHCQPRSEPLLGNRPASRTCGVKALMMVVSLWLGVAVMSVIGWYV